MQVRELDAAGSIGALVRELAWQAGVAALSLGERGQHWQLDVESETLRDDGTRDRLAAALAAAQGVPVTLELRAGVPADSQARRETAERERAQARAEETIRNDPVVVELMSQYTGARIVPGSIRPLMNSEGSPS